MLIICVVNYAKNEKNLEILRYRREQPAQAKEKNLVAYVLSRDSILCRLITLVGLQFRTTRLQMKFNYRKPSLEVQPITLAEITRQTTRNMSCRKVQTDE